jgi:hypothetical protein
VGARLEKSRYLLLAIISLLHRWKVQVSLLPHWISVAFIRLSKQFEVKGVQLMIIATEGLQIRTNKLATGVDILRFMTTRSIPRLGDLSAFDKSLIDDCF